MHIVKGISSNCTVGLDALGLWSEQNASISFFRL